MIARKRTAARQTPPDEVALPVQAGQPQAGELVLPVQAGELTKEKRVSSRAAERSLMISDFNKQTDEEKLERVFRLQEIFQDEFAESGFKEVLPDAEQRILFRELRRLAPAVKKSRHSKVVAEEFKLAGVQGDLRTNLKHYLTERNVGLLTSTARKMTENPDDFPDFFEAATDAYLRSVELYEPDNKKDASFGSYAIPSMEKRILQARRNKAKHGKKERTSSTGNALSAAQKVAIGGRHSVAEAVAKAELMKDIFNREVDGLTDRMRVVLKLFYVHGLSKKRIGEILMPEPKHNKEDRKSVSRERSRQILEEAIQHLRKNLGNLGSLVRNDDADVRLVEFGLAPEEPEFQMLKNIPEIQLLKLIIEHNITKENIREKAQTLQDEYSTRKSQ